ncbi:MAG: hypothetical protein GY859_37485, partial [Desulfobacterales bacterium]|nr:hypothetical protein [Desulfobacterales bacterium]
MTRIFNSDYRDKCRADRPDPYPVHTLKRVDRPTTIIHDDQPPRVDEREGAFNRAGRGDFGPRLQREYKRFVPKHPLSGALVTMAGALGRLVDAPPGSMDQSDTPWGVSSWTPMRPAARDKAPGTGDAG